MSPADDTPENDITREEDVASSMDANERNGDAVDPMYRYAKTDSQYLAAFGIALIMIMCVIKLIQLVVSLFQ